MVGTLGPCIGPHAHEVSDSLDNPFAFITRGYQIQASMY